MKDFFLFYRHTFHETKMPSKVSYYRACELALKGWANEKGMYTGQDSELSLSLPTPSRWPLSSDNCKIPETNIGSIKEVAWIVGRPKGPDNI